MEREHKKGFDPHRIQGLAGQSARAAGRSIAGPESSAGAKSSALYRGSLCHISGTCSQQVTHDVIRANVVQSVTPQHDC